MLLIYMDTRSLFYGFYSPLHRRHVAVNELNVKIRVILILMPLARPFSGSRKYLHPPVDARDLRSYMFFLDFRYLHV